MDFHLKQWRDSDQQQQHESDSSYQQQQPSGQACALPLFTPEPTTNTKLTSSNNLSADSSTTVPTRLSRMGGSCCFSMVQWQELELQALIFRHMLAGAAVPPELLHLVKKSLLLSSSSPYYLPHYPPHYQPALMQSGYWGRGAMDPEPGRCRRTDGKKWRCSRDVMGGHKYCERHMHRGRNRSRKPVEVPTPTSAAGVSVAALANKNNNGGGGVTVAQPFTTMGGGSGGSNFGVSGPSHSLDLLRYNQSQSASESITETKGLFRTQTKEDKSGGRILRHFFDDWPRSGQEPENTMSNACPGTCLSISVPGNPSSDFALKLSTGNDREEPGPEDRNNNNNINVERERAQVNWGSGSAWGTNQMGGPLAEALRSSTSSTSSPTSVLHQLRGSNYIST